MKEEELIHVLRETAVPNVLCNNYRLWLRTNILQRVVSVPVKIRHLEKILSLVRTVVTELYPQTRTG